jgi:hypothetical protein
MKNFFNFLVVIALAAVIGYVAAGCNYGEKEEEDAATNTQAAQLDIAAVAPPANLVGVYFGAAGQAQSSNDAGRKFEITPDGKLMDNAGYTHFITAVTGTDSGTISLSRAAPSGTTVYSGPVDYVYAPAIPPTLAVSNFKSADPVLGVLGEFLEGTYYKRN